MLAEPRLTWRHSAGHKALGASVIVVNYNAGPLLADCCQALRQTLPADAEVIVMDNGSTDGSADCVEKRFPEMRVLYLARNAGFGAANNRAARIARGQHLVFLNPDTVVEPGWLEALLRPFAADPTVGATTAQVVYADRPDVINACGNDVHVSGLAMCQGLGEPRRSQMETVDVAAVSGAAFAIRADLFEALEGFDEDFFLYVEDTDLSQRIWMAGWRCVCAPLSVVRHHYRLRFGPRKTYYQERNRYVMLIKILRWPTLLALLPALLLAELLTWGFVALRDRVNWRNKLEAYVWIRRHWRSLMASRRVARSTRHSEARDRAWLLRAGHRIDLGQVGAGWVTRTAQALFDPAFYALRGLALALVWW